MLGVVEKSFHLLDKLSVQLFLCAGLEFGTFAGQNLIEAKSSNRLPGENPVALWYTGTHSSTLGQNEGNLKNWLV